MNIRGAEESLRKGNATEARRLLQRCDPPLRRWEWYHLWLKADSSVAVLQTDGSGVVSVGFRSDGKRILANTATTMYVWDSITKMLVDSYSVRSLAGTIET